MRMLVLTPMLILATSVAGGGYLSEKPTFLKSCRLDDPNYAACFADNFAAVFSGWPNGIPGHKSVGKFDPLHVKRVKISQTGSGPITMRAELTDILLSGLSKMEIQMAKVDTKDFSCKVKAFVPKMRFDSDYEMDGRVLGLALRGHGKSFMEAENTVLTIQMLNELRDGENGFTFWDVKAVKMDIKDIGGMRLRYDNLFGGNRDLEEAANNLINENWRQLYETLKPVIVQTVEAILFDRLGKIFHYVPLNYFIADIPKASDVKS